MLVHIQCIHGVHTYLVLYEKGICCCLHNTCKCTYLQCSIHPALTISIALERTQGYAGASVVCQGKAGCNMLDVLSTESGISVAIFTGENVAASWIVERSTIDIPLLGNAFKSKAVGRFFG